MTLKTLVGFGVSHIYRLESFWGAFAGVQDQVSLCSAGCPGTHSVDQAGLELMEVCLPPPVPGYIRNLNQSMQIL